PRDRAMLRRARSTPLGIAFAPPAARGGATIRTGCCCATEPFVLTPEDSGRDHEPVVYAAYPGERSVVSGGRALAGWRKGPKEILDHRASRGGAGQLVLPPARRRRSPEPAGRSPVRRGARTSTGTST